MADLTHQMIDYAVAYIEVGLRRRYGSAISQEDFEDIKMYCLAKLCRKWEGYNPAKSRWKTYICCILKSALLDAVKWHYRQHQRLQTVPIDDEHEAIMARDQEREISDLIDELFADDDTARRIAALRYVGCSQREICKKLRLTKQDYLAALVRIHEKLKERIQPY